MATATKIKTTTTDPASTDQYASVEAGIMSARAEHGSHLRLQAEALSEEGRLRAALRRGDLSVTAADLAAAMPTVAVGGGFKSVATIRAEQLAMGSKLRVQRAERQKPVRPTLALLVADALRQHLDDVPVELVDDLPEDDGKSRKVYVVQDERPKAHDRMQDYGTGQRMVRIIFQRPSFAKPLDAKVLAEALESIPMAGVYLDSGHSVITSESGGRGVDYVKVSASHFPIAPGTIVQGGREGMSVTDDDLDDGMFE